MAGNNLRMLLKRGKSGFTSFSTKSYSPMPIARSFFSSSSSDINLPFTSVVMYRNPPILEPENLKTSVAIDVHEQALRDSTPQVLAKFVTPKDNTRFQIREMIFDSSEPIKEVFARALPHFPSVQSINVYNRRKLIPEEQTIEHCMREELYPLSLRLTMVDGSEHSVNINGGLRVSMGPGFGETITFFRNCAFILATAFITWGLVKPTRDVHPELAKYKRGAEPEAEDEALRATEDAEQAAVERGLIWEELERADSGDALTSNLPWVPKKRPDADSVSPAL